MENKVKKFDRFISSLMIGLAVIILVMVLIGDRTFPKVVSTNLTQQINPAELKYVQLTFNRLMDRKSVEDGFKIDPNVPGKFSWSGKNFVFTPDKSFQYGQIYNLTIAKTAHSQDGKEMEKNYVQNFGTSQLRIAYLSNDGEDAGKIVFTDLKGNKLKTLTDGSFKIDKFIPSPDGSSIYFLATKNNQTSGGAELYNLNIASNQIQQLTNDSKFLNKNFTISDEGTKLLLNRIQVSSSGEYLTRIEVWLADTADLLAGKQDALKVYLNGQAQGLDAGFSPKGVYLLYRNKDSNYELTKISADTLGTANNQSTDQQQKDQQDEKLYIGEYSTSFGFHPFLPKIAFTEYDQNNAFSLNNKLVLFSGDGDKKYLPLDGGIIRDAQFSKDGKSIIALFSGKADDLTSASADALTAKRLYHLYRINLADDSVEQLTNDSDYSELSPVVSNDSRYILFGRMYADENLVDPAFLGVDQDVNGKTPETDLWLYDSDDKSLNNLKIKGINAIFLP